MRTLANIIWHVPFMGFVNAFFAFIVGSILVLTIVAAPIGLGIIEYAKFLLRPFSYKMVDRDVLDEKQNQLWKIYGFLLRIVYFPIGLIFAIVLLFQIVGLIFSIV